MPRTGPNRITPFRVFVGLVVGLPAVLLFAAGIPVCQSKLCDRVSLAETLRDEVKSEADLEGWAQRVGTRVHVMDLASTSSTTLQAYFYGLPWPPSGAARRLYSIWLT